MPILFPPNCVGNGTGPGDIEDGCPASRVGLLWKLGPARAGPLNFEMWSDQLALNVPFAATQSALVIAAKPWPLQAF
jgi:hypothetical protein